jgi:predicted TPR repeat methyltransferase
MIPAAKLLKQALQAHNSGDLSAAEKMYRKILRRSSNDLNANYLLGTLCAERGQLAEAEKHLLQAARLDSQSAFVQTNLGNVYRLQSEIDKAISHYKRALFIDPNQAEANYNLAQICEDKGDYQGAFDLYQKATEANPGLFEAQHGLAMVSKALGHTELAKISLGRALQICPDRPSVQHLFAALSGDNPSAPPDSYVARLFNSYAPRFDAQLVKQLGYAAPLQLRELLESAVPPSTRFQTALDLGCGTGLSGEAFRTLTEKLIGVDIAPKMLDIALKKKIYDALYKQPIKDFLLASPEKFDLVIATDVFIYMGALEYLFELLPAHMSSGGYFIFSTELLDNGTYQLLHSGRYAHSQDYIKKLALNAGFAINATRQIDLRKEMAQWIKGELYILQFA